MSTTVTALIRDHDGAAPSLGAPGRQWMDYEGLRRLSDEVRSSLHEIGIGRGDRVAIVLPNGPEMAAAFVTIAQVATTAPLNPAYRLDEFDFYFKDLSAKALVVTEGDDGPAVAAAQANGIAVLRLVPRTDGPAGQFSLVSSQALPGAERSAPEADDLALILHTSGTTSRPKIVPLTQANVFASAHNIAASLDLSAPDRCLNIMPLFHIHGLIAGVSASLSAGAQICCAPGFNGLKFFSLLDAIRPSWYTAVPTMHQSILDRAPRNREIIARAPLRFLRSSSASLPAPVMEALADAFNAPVIEAYGMTEATHQMCCNPLPPRVQKPGSVGMAAGPDVQIAHEVEPTLLDPHETGEIVISGANVTPGYENNDRANADAFFECHDKRWFRTGDQGAFGADGYLRLTGRLKEIIIRGGEKISPLEVDAALLRHPQVAQAVCFAIPHQKLGEDIAAAVVLDPDATLNADQIRAFAAERLAKFKVPAQVVILDEIPKGATGKIQRIGLAKALGLAAS